jgi:hypothetical protein
MRKGARQKLNGDGWDWTCLRSRRLVKWPRLGGVGKRIKRQMSRQRRHARIDPEG